ncbi:hypothetical protein MTO96_023016 [Rhipicephalus appendiculatus]
MPRASKRAKYCDPILEDVTTEDVDTQDAEVQELYRKGLEVYQVDSQSDHRVDDTCAITEDGAALTYEKISKKEAAVLRRVLMSGPPVKELCLDDISLDEFKAAFENLDQCPSLRSVNVHVDLKGKDLGPDFWKVFRGLHLLELSCYNTGSGYAKEIASYIQQNKTLSELRLCNSCGGDEGAAVLIEALVGNDTLKIFSLNDIKSSSDTLIGFAKMLVSNSTLELVSLGDVCCVEVDEVRSLFAQERYAGVFQRLQIVWPDELLSVLNELIRREACSPELFVRVTSSVDEGVLGEFFDAVAENKTLRRLYFESKVSDAHANGIASVVKSTRTLREILSVMVVEPFCEGQLITILNALKENSSITDFTMRVQTVTLKIATSLSELLTVNKALKNLLLCGTSNISPTAGKIILQGLRANYTLTELMVCSKFDENDITRDIEALLNRNRSILQKAVELRDIWR